MTAIDPYTLLGVATDASTAEIKAAWRAPSSSDRPAPNTGLAVTEASATILDREGTGAPTKAAGPAPVPRT